MEIPGGKESLEAFGELFSTWQNHGHRRFEKEFLSFVDLWKWCDLLGLPDQKLFKNRCLALYKTFSAICYARVRYAQIQRTDFPFIVYHCGDASAQLYCGSAHGDLDGLVFAVADPILHRYLPPTRWDCSCFLSGADTCAASRRLGGLPDKPLPDWARQLDPVTGLAQRVDAIFTRSGEPELGEIILAIGRGDADLL